MIFKQLDTCVYFYFVIFQSIFFFLIPLCINNFTEKGLNTGLTCAFFVL